MRKIAHPASENHRVQGVMIHKGMIVYQVFPGMNPTDRHAQNIHLSSGANPHRRYFRHEIEASSC